MPDHVPDFADAFARLERALLRRRLAGIEPVLRIELAALSAFWLAVLFWRMHMRLGSIAFTQGGGAAAADCAAALSVLALGGGAVAALRHATCLESGAPGPAWLVLPIPPAEVHRHLARDSRQFSRLAALPAATVLGAGVGSVGALPLVALAAGFGIALDLASRLGTAAAFGLAWLRAGRHAGDPATSVLADAGRRVRLPRVGAVHWRREGAMSAFLRKDLLVTVRPGAPRERLLLPLGLGLLSLVAWWIPLAPHALATLALGLALLAAAGLASWIVALTSGDPFPVVKSLPLGVGVVWGARFAWAALGAVLLAAGQAVASSLAPPPAARAPVFATALATLAIGTLGANYAITLFPRAQTANRILGIALTVSIVASLMFPILGWILLFAALVHSARHLKRWARLEAV
jgi:hypothetical protein